MCKLIELNDHLEVSLPSIRIFKVVGIGHTKLNAVFHGELPKKDKKLHTLCEVRGGQQNLVCEPQKSGYF